MVVLHLDLQYFFSFLLESQITHYQRQFALFSFVLFCTLFVVPLRRTSLFHLASELGIGHWIKTHTLRQLGSQLDLQCLFLNTVSLIHMLKDHQNEVP